MGIQPFLKRSSPLLENQAERYKMAFILKNSDGWKVLFPMLIQRFAPKSLVPTMGKKTAIKSRKFIISSIGVIFFKKDKGIL